MVLQTARISAQGGKWKAQKEIEKIKIETNFDIALGLSNDATKRLKNALKEYNELLDQENSELSLSILFPFLNINTGVTGVNVIKKITINSNITVKSAMYKKILEKAVEKANKYPNLIHLLKETSSKGWEYGVDGIDTIAALIFVSGAFKKAVEGHKLYGTSENGEKVPITKEMLDGYTKNVTDKLETTECNYFNPGVTNFESCWAQLQDPL
jgi:hypothetical protein